jgi:hypothetical protein
MARSYTVSRTGVTPTPANDVMTIIAPAGGAVKVKRIRASGEDGSSTPMRTVIQRSTGGTTGGGPLTPEKDNVSDAAAGTVVNTTWSAQPALSGSPLYVEGWNTFGGGFDLTLDGREIWLLNSQQLSIRNTVGTGTSEWEVEFEEY